MIYKKIKSEIVGLFESTVDGTNITIYREVPNDKEERAGDVASGDNSEAEAKTDVNTMSYFGGD